MIESLIAALVVVLLFVGLPALIAYAIAGREGAVRAGAWASIAYMLALSLSDFSSDPESVRPAAFSVVIALGVATGCLTVLWREP